MVDDLDELRNKTQSGDRLSDAGSSSDKYDRTPFQEDFDKYLGESIVTTDGRSVSTSDPVIWAAIKALVDNDGRREEFREKAGIANERDSQSKMVGALTKAGLREIDPELIEEIQECVAAKVTEGL